jgi:hypothetical protein
MTLYTTQLQFRGSTNMDRDAMLMFVLHGETLYASPSSCKALDPRGLSQVANEVASVNGQQALFNAIGSYVMCT